MMDGFTTSDHYPYSRSITAGNRSLNYIRNSVKAVIDAYNGTVHFYIFDTSDPLILAYRNMFPQLFSDAKDMPGFLRAHVRYPELLFRAQAAIYATYHVENEQVFYNREDVWTVAQQGRISRDSRLATPLSRISFRCAFRTRMIRNSFRSFPSHLRTGII